MNRTNTTGTAEDSRDHGVVAAADAPPATPGEHRRPLAPSERVSEV